MIKFEKVSFSYDSSPVLREVDFQMGESEFIGILGPNGGGKSTFLKLLLGLLKPTSGRITLTNKRIGYLSQNTSTDDRSFPCTVEECIAMGLPRKMGLFLGKSERKAIEDSLHEYDLCDLRKRLISELSGGQLQRVRLAKALIADPDLIVFDEPDAGMDEESHENMMKTILALHKEGKSVLFVSHHPEDLIRADRIYFIEDGTILTYEEELRRGHHHVSI